MTKGYSGLQIVLHWAIAGLIIANYLISDGMGHAFDGMMKGEAVSGLTPVFHVWAGVSVLVLVLIRALVRKAAAGWHEEPTTLADKAAAALSAIPGARDVKVEQVSGTSEVEVLLDRDAMSRWGLNVADVNELLEAAYAGRVVTTFVEGERRFAVVVRFPEEARKDLPALESLLVPTSGGSRG